MPARGKLRRLHVKRHCAKRHVEDGDVDEEGDILCPCGERMVLHPATWCDEATVCDYADILGKGGHNCKVSSFVIFTDKLARG